MAFHADVLTDVMEEGAQLEQLPISIVEAVEASRAVEEIAGKRLTFRAWASFQPQRRQRPSTDSRRMAPRVTVPIGTGMTPDGVRRFPHGGPIRSPIRLLSPGEVEDGHRQQGAGG